MERRWVRKGRSSNRMTMRMCWNRNMINSILSLKPLLCDWYKRGSHREGYA